MLMFSKKLKCGLGKLCGPLKLGDRRDGRPPCRSIPQLYTTGTVVFFSTHGSISLSSLQTGTTQPESPRTAADSDLLSHGQVHVSEFLT